MAINTNLVKFRRGDYSASWAKSTGRDASTLYFAKHDQDGIGGLWLGDNLISSQVVDAELSQDGLSLIITKLNPAGSAEATSTVTLGLGDVSTALDALTGRVVNIETILDNNQTATSAKLNEIDASILDLSTNKANKTDYWYSLAGGEDASTKLDGIEAGAEVNKINGVKLNGSVITPDASLIADLGSIATSTAVEQAMAEALKHTEVQAAAGNTMVGVSVSPNKSALDGSVYIVDDSSLRTKLGNMDSSIADNAAAAAAAQADVDALEASVGVIPAASSATTVIGYVDEQIGDVSTKATVTVTETAGSGDILKGYEIKQNGITIGTVNIPKDMVATQGELVYGSLDGETFTPNPAGDPYIKMTVGNGTTTDVFYIPVKGLVEYNDVSTTAEIALTNTNHVISAEIVAVDSSKITYDSSTVKDALDDLYTQIGTGGSVASQIQEAIEGLDASVTATGTAANGGVFVISKVNEVDGLLDQNGSAFVEVEQAGAAAAAKATIDAYTVNGKAISTNPVLDGRDLYVDALAGTQETVKHAIERLDEAIGTADVSTQIANAIDSLDSATTASGTPQHDNNGASIFVLSKVNQTDGKLDPVEATKSEAVEVWSAEATKELSDALTWGTFTNS